MLDRTLKTDGMPLERGEDRMKKGPKRLGFGMDFIPDGAIDAFKHHKFQSAGYTWLDSQMDPFWSEIARRIPRHVSPNLISAPRNTSSRPSKGLEEVLRPISGHFEALLAHSRPMFIDFHRVFMDAGPVLGRGHWWRLLRAGRSEHGDRESSLRHRSHSDAR